MRDAENSVDFVEMVWDKLDLVIEVITGEEEGQLTFSGATGQGSIATATCVTLVIDVGGGSTEFIYGRAGEALGATSLDIGSVRLTERFLRHDPPLTKELEAAREAIRETAGLVFEHILEAKPATVIAVAGTATQLSALNYEVEPYDPEKIHGSLLRLTDLEALTSKLASMPLEERKKLRGMHPKRADVITSGALILEESLLELGYPVLVVSEKDILDGLAYSI
jgi:exopolyphosphatase/guanosine-5'-triphosphate,3'-diphosphate pyrophosphatase